MEHRLEPIPLRHTVGNNYYEYFDQLSKNVDYGKLDGNNHTGCINSNGKPYTISLDEFFSFVNKCNGPGEPVQVPFTARKNINIDLFPQFTNTQTEKDPERGYISQKDGKGAGRFSNYEDHEYDPTNENENERKENVWEESSKINYNEGEFDLKKLIYTGDKWEQEFEWSDQVKKINEEVFHNPSFRLNQLSAINCILSNNDTFVIIPTGGGKSLCFQLPAVYDTLMGRESTTIVIMPLLSLIEDQVNRLNDLNISCRAIVGDLKLSEKLSILKDLSRSGKGYGGGSGYQGGEGGSDISVLFITPESLVSSNILKNSLLTMYRNRRISRFVLDEVHCVSQWGNDFRPNYGKLGMIRANFPEVPILALTATATESVIKDVILKLNLRDVVVFKSDFNRKNLEYLVVEKQRSFKLAIKQLIDIVSDFKDSCGIVYCFSCNESERVSRELSKVTSCYHYHAQMSTTMRTRVYNDWINDNVKVIVATIAFGMGIDKKDVRFVVHFSLSKSVENYFQESGRAGRDQRKSTCILMYDYHDVERLMLLTSPFSNANRYAKNKKIQDVETNTDKLLSMMDYCEEKILCRRMMLLGYFGQRFTSKCIIPCDNCKITPNSTVSTLNTNTYSQQPSTNSQQANTNTNTYNSDVNRARTSNLNMPVKPFKLMNFYEHSQYICKNLFSCNRSLTLNDLHKLLMDKSLKQGKGNELLQGYLKSKGIDSKTAMLLLKKMIIHKLLQIRIVQNENAFTLYYIQPNRNYYNYLKSMSKLIMPYPKEPKREKKPEKEKRKDKAPKDEAKKVKIKVKKAKSEVKRAKSDSKKVKSEVKGDKVKSPRKKKDKHGVKADGTGDNSELGSQGKHDQSIYDKPDSSRPKSNHTSEFTKRKAGEPKKKTKKPKFE